MDLSCPFLFHCLGSDLVNRSGGGDEGVEDGEARDQAAQQHEAKNGAEHKRRGQLSKGDFA